jgi:hypothetical protein
MKDCVKTGCSIHGVSLDGCLCVSLSKEKFWKESLQKWDEALDKLPQLLPHLMANKTT